MMRRVKSSGLLLLLVWMPRPLIAAQGNAEDEAAIRAARQAQNMAILAADFDRVAEFWLQDVVVTAGLGFVLRGSEAYRNAFAAESSLVYARIPTEIEVSDRWPLAIETGTWSGWQRGQRERTIIGGRYAAQWVKADDTWRISSELFVALECFGAACDWPVVIR